MDNWLIERLDTKRHDGTDFDCGKPPLSNWIRRYAGQNERRDISRTYVAVNSDEPSRIIGYYSLSTSVIQFTVLPTTQAKGLPRTQPIPVALLGRLAVDLRFKGRGFGAFLLVDALRRTLRLSDEIGIHAVVVDAIDEEARGFYLKHGFHELLDNPRHLFYPMSRVHKLGLGT